MKDDLSEDVQVMFETEIKQRVETGMTDEEGPWKLIAWLEQVQPPFMSGNRLFPSYGLSLLLKELNLESDGSTLAPQKQASAFHKLIARAIEAENAHHLHAIESMIDRTEEAYEAQLASRTDSLDAYFDGLRDRDETPPPQKMLEEINPLVGMQIRLSGEQLRKLGEDLYADSMRRSIWIVSFLLIAFWVATVSALGRKHLPLSAENARLRAALAALESEHADNLRILDNLQGDVAAWRERSAQVPAAALREAGSEPRDAAERWKPPTDELSSGLVREDDRAEDPPPTDEAPAPTERDGSRIVAGTLRAPWRWEELLVEAYVIQGLDRWKRRLTGLAHEYDLRLRELRVEDEDSPRVAAVLRDQEELRHLEDFALPIVETLDGWRSPRQWGEWLRAFEALAPRVLRKPTRVLRVLAEMGPLGSIGPVSLAEVRDVLTPRLLTLTHEPARRRLGAVFIGTPASARGRRFRVVFVPGLAERVFPQRLQRVLGRYHNLDWVHPKGGLSDHS